MTRPQGTNRNSGFYKKALETMPSRRRGEYLDRKLRGIIQYAYRHSPAIRTKLDAVGLEPRDIQTVKDLQTLPITKKTDLIDLQKKDPPFGGFLGIPISELRRIYVSPGPIHEPGEAEYDEICWAQAMFAGGFRPGDRVINTFSYHLVPFALNMLDNSFHQLRCITIPTGVGNTEQQVHVLRNLKVTGFCGTPSFLLSIAEKAEEMGFDLKKDLTLRVAFVAAEMLSESLRSRLEEKFGMVVRQSYGTADIGCLGYECMEKNGMHIPDDKLVEIVDPQTGKQLPFDTPGEIVGTTFNRVYPLIRFGTGDLSLLTNKRCPCGRTSPRLVKILGRIDQMTKVRGLFVHPSQVDEIASRFPIIARHRMLVTREEHKDGMTFQAELREGMHPDETMRGDVERTIRDVIKLRGEVQFVDRGTIPDGARKIEDQRTWD
jgi:phenylacetate-CoA ligase